MKAYRKWRQFLNDYLYDSSINLKDRSFMVFSIAVILALYAAVPCGLIMREPLSATISTLVGAIIFTIYVIYAYKKNKIKQARTVLSVVVIVIFLPAMFFTNGGIYGGAPVWLLLGGFYLIMILDGRQRIIMSLLNLLILLACWIVGYLHPELVTEYTRAGNFFDSFVAYIIVGLVMTVIITFQTSLYERERKIAEEKSQELEELNRSQNSFFSSMSHEIRTPINTVLGLNEIILRQEDASEEIRQDARNIQGAGRLLLALINDILDLSKIEAGKLDILPVNYDVAALLSEIVNMIWLKADEKGLQFNVDIDPDVPKTLYGDEIRIKQVLINLLNNAVKYTREGSVGLHMECEVIDAEDVMLKITVSDTGIGIRPEALPHLFDTFQRADEEKNRHIEGTGLGLSIVKQLVELMNGEIKVNSVYSQGTTFEVSLKQGMSSEQHIGDLSITSSGSVTGMEKYEHSFHAPNARILIVDDNEMNLQVEKKLLEGTGMTIDLAHSGQEALAKTLRSRYDLIFMDHLMPEMDGIECFEKIRGQKGGMNPGTPVIVLTANAGGENIELYNEAGFDSYLVKPVTGRQLEDMVLSFLPAEKVAGGGGIEITSSLLNTASRYSKKKSVIIAVNNTCDLPQNVLQQLDISTIPCTVYTNEGAFYDNVDIDADELIRYISDESKQVRSEAPTEEAYIKFFSEELKKAHHLIFIAFTSGSSEEYVRAVNAAKTFENVTVINSESMSSGSGLLALVAARLAQQNTPLEKMVAELEAAKERISCTFVVKSTNTISKQGKLSPTLNMLFNLLYLRPVLRMKKDRLGVGKLFIGSIKKCYQKYIKYVLPSDANIDKSLLIVPYVGMAEDDLIWIEDMIHERVQFDHVIFQKSSAGVAANCGEGSFGIHYLTKGDRNYNLGTFFESIADEEEIYSIPDEISEERPEEKEPSKASEEIQEEVIIGGIDRAAALKNSGSEEMMHNLMQMFHDSYEEKSAEIQRCYEDKDWENYIIRVHALKSSARLVGALSLGDNAQALEMAGKRKDYDFIKANHNALMAEYHAINEVLAPGKDAEEDEDPRPSIPAEVLEDAYTGLYEFAQDENQDLARMIMGTVSNYKLSSEDEERFKKIEEHLSNMDWDGLKTILEEVI